LENENGAGFENGIAKVTAIASAFVHHDHDLYPYWMIWKMIAIANSISTENGSEKISTTGSCFYKIFKNMS
jgi:hypothetical protein